MIPNRRPCITEDVEGGFSVTVSFCPVRLLEGEIIPVEIFYSKRAKPGTEMDEIQYQFGVTASKLMQGRF